MKNFGFLFLCGFIFMGCSSSTPKGQYSKSKVERPYALPDDVATFAFGQSTVITKSSELDIVLDEDDSAEAAFSIPYFRFEQGISKNASWLYPLGFKWAIFENETSMFGVSAASVIFYSTLSVDYWHKISEKISLRPYFRTRNISFFIINEQRQGPGLDILYQATEKFALSIGGGAGTYSANSDFIDAIVNDINDDDESDTRVDGTYTGFNLTALYSITDSWDFNFEVGSSTDKVEDFTLETTNMDIGFTYIY